MVAVTSRWWETSAWGQSFRAGGANHSQPYFPLCLIPMQRSRTGSLLHYQSVNSVWPGTPYLHVIRFTYWSKRLTRICTYLSLQKHSSFEFITVTTTHQKIYRKSRAEESRNSKIMNLLWHAMHTISLSYSCIYQHYGQYLAMECPTTPHFSVNRHYALPPSALQVVVVAQSWSWAVTRTTASHTFYGNGSVESVANDLLHVLLDMLRSVTHLQPLHYHRVSRLCM